MWLGYPKKWWAIGAISFVAIILLTFGVLSLVSGNDKPADDATASQQSAAKDTAQSGQDGNGIGLSGNKLAVSGSVISLRNLKGMLAQINQIDICGAPDLKAYITVTAEDASAVSKLTKNDFKVYVDGKESKDFSLELVSKRI